MARNSRENTKTRAVSPQTRALHTMRFDAEMGVYGMKRVTPYVNFGNHVELECSRGHTWETTPRNMNIKQKYQTEQTKWHMCPDCSEDIDQIVRLNQNTMYARQRGFKIRYSDHAASKWQYECECCGERLGANPNQHLSMWLKCPGCGEEETNTVWCADDGVNAVLWVGREPEYVRRGSLNVYPVWGEMIGRSFVGEDGAHITPQLIKLLKSPARSKGVELMALAIPVVEHDNNVTVIVTDKQGNHMPPVEEWGDSPLTRELTHDLKVKDNFWDKNPPVIEIKQPEITVEPIELSDPETFWNRLPDDVVGNESFTRRMEEALAGNHHTASTIALALTGGTHPSEEKLAGGIFCYTYMTANFRKFSGCHTDRSIALLDAALAACPSMYGGRLNKERSADV